MKPIDRHLDDPEAVLHQHLTDPDHLGWLDPAEDGNLRTGKPDRTERHCLRFNSSGSTAERQCLTAPHQPER
eukprot:SAG22_NODE_8285_length_667_cov_0.994718_1_plen_71_part_10